VAERLVEQGERAFFEIPIGRLTTEAVARPTMRAPDARDRLVDLLAAVSDTPVGDTHVAKDMIDRSYG
jgi:hypothetical protein